MTHSHEEWVDLAVLTLDFGTNVSHENAELNCIMVKITLGLT